MVTSIEWPVPSSVTALAGNRLAFVEAAAGTGKTWLLERAVVDAILNHRMALEEILVVTFTERATTELRARIRSMIVNVLDGEPPHSPTAEEATWTLDRPARQRLRESLAVVDRVSISTIHGFCQSVLASEAFSTATLFEQTLVDGSDIFVRAARSVLRRALAEPTPLGEELRRFSDEGGHLGGLVRLLTEVGRDPGELRPRPDPVGVANLLDELESGASVVGGRLTDWAPPGRPIKKLERAKASVREWLSKLDPADPVRITDAVACDRSSFLYLAKKIEDDAGAPRELTSFANLLRRLESVSVTREASLVRQLLEPIGAELATEKLDRGWFDFDDLIVRVRSLVRERPAVLERLRSRYRWAFVDEFQDTDPIQWEIFETIFLDAPTHRLCVIGDPKQAIYSFRGADVGVYREARRRFVECGSQPHGLTVNYRSSRSLIDSFNLLFTDEYFEAPEPTAAVGCGRTDLELVDDSSGSVHLIALDSPDVRRSPTEQIERHSSWVGAEIRRLLAAARLEIAAGPRRLVPSDFMVLTGTNREAETVARILARAGLSVQHHLPGGIWATAEARSVLEVLVAIEDPSRSRSRRRALVSGFFDVPLEQAGSLVSGMEEQALARLWHWHSLVTTDRLGSLISELRRDSGVVARRRQIGDHESAALYRRLLDRVLATSRDATDFTDLVARIERLVSTPDGDETETGDALPVDAERRGVQVLTMHKAKGLEAPIVFVLNFGGMRAGRIGLCTVDGERQVWIRPVPSWVAEHEQRTQRDEERRLCYVAATRAEARLYVPWMGQDGSKRLGTAPLRRLHDRLVELDAPSNGLFTMRGSKPAPVDVPGREDHERGRSPVVVRDADWWSARREAAGRVVTSYSRLKRADDAVDHQIAVTTPVDHTSSPPDPLPGGVETGLLVHHLFEIVPFGAVRSDGRGSEAEQAFERRARAVTRRYGLDDAATERALEVVRSALATPVALDGLRLPLGLGSLERIEREVELDFPLPDGHAVPGRRTERRGFVRCIVDLVFEHDGLVYFLDWKSDRLASFDEDSVSRHVSRHYADQARLYTLAVGHLLGGLDPVRRYDRFGGFLYCFVRGIGPSTGSDGFYFSRPELTAVQGWQTDLADRDVTA